jgi:hypothetical protein
MNTATHELRNTQIQHCTNAALPKNVRPVSADVLAVPAYVIEQLLMKVI